MAPLREWRWFGTALLVLCLPHAVPGGAEAAARTGKGQGSWLVMRPSDQDVILPITSVEWGVPDRWSFTARYVHMFEQNRGNRSWLNNFTVTASPGISGGRLGVGYQGIFSGKRRSDMGLFSEARAVLLRTWRNPLGTAAGRTFAGAEIRVSLPWMINVGGGYYAPVSAGDEQEGSFWGWHIGIGI